MLTCILQDSGEDKPETSESGEEKEGEPEEEEEEEEIVDPKETLEEGESLWFLSSSRGKWKATDGYNGTFQAVGKGWDSDPVRGLLWA